MKRGASTQIFHKNFTARGLVMDYNDFRDAYFFFTKKQNDEARIDWRELDYKERLRLALQSVGFKQNDIREIVNEVWEEYLSEWPRQSTLYDGTATLLDALRERYKLGLVTNYPDGPTARKVFRKFGFEEVFDSLVVSGEVGYRKPSRIIFESSLSELDVRPEAAMMVGDTFLADVVGPKEMGMKAILIDADDSQAENYQLPDAVVKSIREVGEVIKQLL